MLVISSLSSSSDRSARRRSWRAWTGARWSVAACTALCLLALALSASSAPAVEYVNGISDQSLSEWDHGFGEYFTNFFKETWLPAGHLKYARFAMPWNESSGGTDNVYKNWCA